MKENLCPLVSLRANIDVEQPPKQPTQPVSRQKIRIRPKGHDQRVIDRAAQDIIETAKSTGARIAEPIPLPTKREI